MCVYVCLCVCVCVDVFMVFKDMFSRYMKMPLHHVSKAVDIMFKRMFYAMLEDMFKDMVTSCLKNLMLSLKTHSPNV